MFKATPFEYHWRYAIHAVIYTLGFFAPPERLTSFSLGAGTWWLLLASLPAREHWLSFIASSQILLALACLSAAAGAALRIWGASYLSASVVHSSSMHGTRVLADGPFRHLRNPLYLGTILNTLALAMLMPPTGAILSIVLITLFQIRLARAEEPFLLNKLGEPYRLYCAAVPRFLPSLRPRVPSAGASADLRSGILSEVFVLGTAITFLTVGWSFNATAMLKGILISLGLSIIARAFIPNRLAASSDVESIPG